MGRKNVMSMYIVNKLGEITGFGLGLSLLILILICMYVVLRNIFRVIFKITTNKYRQINGKQIIVFIVALFMAYAIFITPVYLSKQFTEYTPPTVEEQITYYISVFITYSIWFYVFRSSKVRVIIYDSNKHVDN